VNIFIQIAIEAGSCHMKFSHKFILVSLVGALVAPMVLKGPDGKPYMSLNDWIPHKAVAFMADTKDSAQSAIEGSGQQIFYKWQDKDGSTQLTLTKPSHLNEDQIEERVIYANANIIPGLDQAAISRVMGQSTPAPQAGNRKAFVYNPKKPKDVLSDTSSSDGLDKSDSSGFSIGTVPINKIPDLMNQARNVDTLVKKRAEAMQQY